ncbi:RNA-directed RNA polymerase, partial [Circulifer tenellus virus 1]
PLIDAYCLSRPVALPLPRRAAILSGRHTPQYAGCIYHGAVERYTIHIEDGFTKPLPRWALPGGGSIKIEWCTRKAATQLHQLWLDLVAIESDHLLPHGLHFGYIQAIAVCGCDGRLTSQDGSSLAHPDAAVVSDVPICSNAPKGGLISTIRVGGCSNIRASDPKVAGGLLRAIECVRLALVRHKCASRALADQLLAEYTPEYVSNTDPHLAYTMRQEVIRSAGPVQPRAAGWPRGGLACHALAYTLQSGHGHKNLASLIDIASTNLAQMVSTALDMMAIAALALPALNHDGENASTGEVSSLRHSVANWLDACVGSLIHAPTVPSACDMPKPDPSCAAWLTRRFTAWVTEDGLFDWRRVCYHEDHFQKFTSRLFPGNVIKTRGHNGSGYRGQTVFLRSSKTRKHLKCLNLLFPSPSSTDSRHQTLHISDYIWSLIRSRIHGWTPSSILRKVNAVLRHIPVGTFQTTAMAMVMASLGSKSGDLISKCYLSSGLLWRPMAFQRAALKAYSNLARRCATTLAGESLTDAEVAQLAYYDLSFGRSLNTTNWDEEYRNRCIGTLHIQAPSLSIVFSPLGDNRVMLEWKSDLDNTSYDRLKRSSRFYTMLRRELREMCDVLVTKRNTSEPLDKFFKRRHEWMASGSSAGFTMPVSLKRGSKAKGEQWHGDVKVSKRAWAETIDTKDVLHELYLGDPQEVATASEKYENGKARAIYGVAPMHYVLNTYATKGFEERFHLVEGLEKGASGAHAVTLEQARANITADPDIECSMFDYADFNRHHTPEAQAIVFDVFAELGQAKGANPDWVRANQWVAQAKRSMYTQLPDREGRHRVYQGMFSGTRSTDLLNTLLNLAYFRVARRYVDEQLGVHAIDMYHVHQGDDVWVSNRNPTWARALFYVLNNMGFIFQKSKQMFGVGRGEYLRVLYSSGHGYGYLGRAIANYILRPIQNANPISPISWATSINDSMALLVRRGLSIAMADVLYDNNVSFWVRARAHAKDRAPVSLPREYVRLPRILGGLGAMPPSQILPTPNPDSPVLPPLPTMSTTFKSQALNVPTKMTDDWLRYISSRRQGLGGVLDDPTIIRTDLLRQEMIQSNFSGDLANVLPERGWAKYKRDIAKLSASVPKWASELLARSRPLPPDPDALVDTVINDIYPTPYPLRSSVPQYPVLQQHCSYLQGGKVFKMERVGGLSDTLQAIITRSTFKSEKTMAKALGITRVEAIAQILVESNDLGADGADVAALLYPVLNAGNEQLLELLLGQGGELIPHLSLYASPTYWQHMQRVWLDILCNAIRHGPTLNATNVVYGDARGWAVWSQSLRGDHNLLTSVVY